MRIRRLVVVGLALLVAIGIAACGDSNDDGGTAAATTPASTTPASTSTGEAVESVDKELGLGNPSPDLCPADGKKYKIGYDQWSDVQPYAAGISKSMDAAAAKTGCVEVTTLTDNADAATALANVKTLLQQKVDAVALFQIVASAQPGIMREINKAGVPAVATITPAEGATFVSLDPAAAGKAAGEALAGALKAKTPDATSPWVILGTDEAAGEYDTQVNGQVEAAVKAAYPDVPDSQVVRVDTKSSPDVAFKNMTNTIAKIPKDKPILLSGVNDEVVGSMFRVLKQKGYAANTLVMGMGGLYPLGAHNVCVNPEYVGTVDFLPENTGNYMIPALLALLQKKTVPASIVTPIQTLDKAQAAEKYPELDECAA